MCMIDDADGCVTMLGESEPKARKAHRCSECARTIRPGETYRVERFVFDGEMHHHKTCSHCMVARQWLRDECGGFIYGSVEEDIREHAGNGFYGLRVKLLAVGMDRQWLRKDGRPWPLPRLPKTTHERLGATQPSGTVPMQPSEQGARNDTESPRADAVERE